MTIIKPDNLYETYNPEVVDGYISGAAYEVDRIAEEMEKLARHTRALRKYMEDARDRKEHLLKMPMKNIIVVQKVATQESPKTETHYFNTFMVTIPEAMDFEKIKAGIVGMYALDALRSIGRTYIYKELRTDFVEYTRSPKYPERLAGAELMVDDLAKGYAEQYKATVVKVDVRRYK